MKYKHIPGGLFPHFDCGFERRPLWAEPGGEISLGCRLDAGAERLALNVLHAGEAHILDGELVNTNDLGQKYFSFTMTAPLTGESFDYRFVSETGEVSKTYTCPLTQRRRLSFAGSCRCENGIWAAYGTDTLEVGLKIELFPCIRLIFTTNFNVKINYNTEICEQFRPNHEIVREDGKLRLSKDGRTLFEAADEIEVRVSGGKVIELCFGLSLPGRAAYGFGEKFDRVDQAGLKPLNYVVEQYSHQQDKSYMPVPFMFTDAGVSFLQRGFRARSLI